MNAPERILMYSHDTFGLGHIRRTQKIANSLAGPDRAILIACASPKTSSFSSRPGIEYLSLPGFVKQVNGEYLPRNLNIPSGEFVELRASLLLSAARSFSPNLVIVDKEPLGVRGELLPMLEHLRSKRKRKTRIVCGFRDILDEPPAVTREWLERGTCAGLRYFYDDILVYGDRRFYDFAEEYALSQDLASRLIYTGYLNLDDNLDSEPLPFHFGGGGLPVVTFTLGGGGDGWDLMDEFLDALLREPPPPFHTILLTGPFAPTSLVEKARRAGDRRRNASTERRGTLEVADFVANTRTLFSRSDVVVSMGGYNTLCELAALKKYPLVVPRVTPRKEQLIRARTFKERGYCDYIEPAGLDGSVMLQAVIRHLETRPSEVPDFPTGGLQAVSRFAAEKLGSLMAKA